MPSASRVTLRSMPARCLLVAGIDFHLSAVLGVRFEVEEALVSGRDALDLARRLGAPHLEAMAWIVIGQAHAAAAKRTEAEAAGREALRLAGDDPEVAGLVDGGRAEHWPACSWTTCPRPWPSCARRSRTCAASIERPRSRRAPVAPARHAARGARRRCSGKIGD